MVSGALGEFGLLRARHSHSQREQGSHERVIAGREAGRQAGRQAMHTILAAGERPIRPSQLLVAEDTDAERLECDASTIFSSFPTGTVGSVLENLKHIGFDLSRSNSGAAE